jgi:hypothetical protein
MGGPPYKKSDPCSVAYRAVATESATDLRVDILEASPAQPPTPPPPAGVAVGACADVGYRRNVSVALEAPFGKRKLLDNQFNRQQSVFDGSLLATPMWIPPGWTEGPENTGPLASRQQGQWTRSWSGPPPGVTGDHCTP